MKKILNSQSASNFLRKTGKPDNAYNRAKIQKLYSSGGLDRGMFIPGNDPGLLVLKGGAPTLASAKRALSKSGLSFFSGSVFKSGSEIHEKFQRSAGLVDPQTGRLLTKSEIHEKFQRSAGLVDPQTGRLLTKSEIREKFQRSAGLVDPQTGRLLTKSEIREKFQRSAGLVDPLHKRP
jgi:hypothetical protein